MSCFADPPRHLVARPGFIQPAWWGTVLCCIFGLAGAALGDRPNVLFIAIDDLRNDLGCLGVQHAHTPHLDALAVDSRLFTRHYVQVPTCGARLIVHRLGSGEAGYGLFDYRHDPDVTRNVADEHPEVVKRLLAHLNDVPDPSAGD